MNMISHAFFIMLGVSTFREGLYGRFRKKEKKYLTNLRQPQGVEPEFQTAFSGVFPNTTF